MPSLPPELPIHASQPKHLADLHPCGVIKPVFHDLSMAGVRVDDRPFVCVDHDVLWVFTGYGDNEDIAGLALVLRHLVAILHQLCVERSATGPHVVVPHVVRFDAAVSGNSDEHPDAVEPGSRPALVPPLDTEVAPRCVDDLLIHHLSADMAIVTVCGTYGSPLKFSILLKSSRHMASVFTQPLCTL